MAADLRRVIGLFGVAWRLIDDVQDIDLDVASGQPNAVQIALDDAGKVVWAECHSRNAAAGSLDAAQWERLVSVAQAGVAPVLAEIRRCLETASATALLRGWTEMSRELAETLAGLTAR